MDLTSGFPFWPASAGLLGVYPSLAADLDCQVAVVGGGVTGALAAYRLVEAGFETVLLDKRDIGWGSTSASTALLQYELDTPLNELVKKIGVDDALAAYRAGRDGLSGFEQLVTELDDDCGFAWRPSLTLASRRRDVVSLEREFELRRRHGFDLEYWDRQKLADHFPCDRPAALFTPEAAEIDPYRLTHGLLRGASERGLRVFDRTEIVRWKEVRGAGRRSRMRLTSGEGHWITAETIVDARGYEAARSIGRAGKVRLRNTYAMISEPVPEARLWYERSLIWETSRPYLYLRTTPDHRVIVGGKDDRFASPARRDRSVESRSKSLMLQYNDLFPDAPIERAFCLAGTFAETGDGLPYIGTHPGTPGVLSAFCYGGNGTLFALIAAEIIREACLGGSHPAERLFRFDR
jgi:glycine/D-amino acid oxidase-like deaminating enzyme